MSAWLAIPLQGKHGVGRFALIDADDLALVSQYKWHVCDGYARTSGYWVNGVRRGISMHRLILAPPPGLVVDHANSIKLDNRRSNIRMATPGQNTANSATRDADTWYRGITFFGRKWVAQCRLGDIVRIGEAATAEGAALLYDDFARELHGKFARLNFPQAGERGPGRKSADRECA